MSRVFDKNGNRLKTYDENGNEVCVISTLQADEEWMKQYEQTRLVEKVAITEGIAILGLIAVQAVRIIGKGWN